MQMYLSSLRNAITYLKIRKLHRGNYCWNSIKYKTLKNEKLSSDRKLSIRDVLSRLGDKWSMLVLITLNANGTMRFSDIHKTIEDVSQRMLTVTLRTLESDGLVERKVYAEVPPRVEYCLTDTGGTLIPHIEGLVGWALENMDTILDHRQMSR